MLNRFLLAVSHGTLKTPKIQTSKDENRTKKHNVEHNATDSDNSKYKIDIKKKYFVTHFCTPRCFCRDRNCHWFLFNVVLEILWIVWQTNLIVFRMRNLHAHSCYVLRAPLSFGNGNGMEIQDGGQVRAQVTRSLSNSSQTNLVFAPLKTSLEFHF